MMFEYHNPQPKEIDETAPSENTEKPKNDCSRLKLKHQPQQYPTQIKI